MQVTQCSTEDIARLFDHYIEHMSQFVVIENKATWHSAAIHYLDSYSAGSGRYLYAIADTQDLCGFAMVNEERKFNSDGLAIADFYIEQNFQRRGYGSMLAKAVFERLPGQWEVAVINKNKTAYSFWHQVISTYTDGDYNKWQVPSYDGAGFSFKK